MVLSVKSSLYTIVIRDIDSGAVCYASSQGEANTRSKVEWNRLIPETSITYKLKNRDASKIVQDNLG